jgi:hypothetical protein
MTQSSFGPFCAVVGVGAGMGVGVVVACIDGGEVVVEARGWGRGGSSGRVNSWWWYLWNFKLAPMGWSRDLTIFIFNKVQLLTPLTTTTTTSPPPSPLLLLCQCPPPPLMTANEPIRCNVGPNNDCVVWAISKFFLFISSFS